MAIEMMENGRSREVESFCLKTFDLLADARQSALNRSKMVK